MRPGELVLRSTLSQTTPCPAATPGDPHDAAFVSSPSVHQPGGGAVPYTIYRCNSHDAYYVFYSCSTNGIDKHYTYFGSGQDKDTLELGFQHAIASGQIATSSKSPKKRSKSQHVAWVGTFIAGKKVDLCTCCGSKLYCDWEDDPKNNNKSLFAMRCSRCGETAFYSYTTKTSPVTYTLDHVELSKDLPACPQAASGSTGTLSDGSPVLSPLKKARVNNNGSYIPEYGMYEPNYARTERVAGEDTRDWFRRIAK